MKELLKIGNRVSATDYEKSTIGIVTQKNNDGFIVEDEWDGSIYEFSFDKTLKISILTNGKAEEYKKIYTAFDGGLDMTFIIEDTINTDGKVASTEVIGFYFGNPDDECTKIYAGKLKAEFEW